MKNRRKALIIFAILGAILCAAAIWGIGVLREPEKALRKVMSDKVDLQVRNVRYTEVGDSGMRWEIVADTARYLKTENLALFEKVMVKLVMKDGKTYVLNGDRGKFHTESRDMEIEGNVVIESEDSGRFTADRLTYRDAEKKVETNGPVVMERGGVRVSGVGMVYTLGEKKVSVLSKVNARITGKIGR